MAGKEQTGSLSGIALLQGMSAADLARLATGCAVRSYPKDQEIFGQDSENRDVFFVVRGRVRVTIFSPDGTEVTFRDLGAGASFGELSAIDGKERSASVVALADTVLAALPRVRFMTLLREQPMVTERVLRNLAALVRSLTERVVEFSTLAVQNRIHAELLRMASEAGVHNNRASISPAPRHAEIASRVSTNREAVSRELGRLKRLGLLDGARRTLVVRDVDGLRELVDQVRDS